MRYFRKFIMLSWTEKRLLAEALIFLYTAWLMKLILPFKSCLKMVKRSNLKEVEADPQILKQIAIALHRANYLRIWKNPCLVSSFAGRWMLNLRGIKSVLSIGVGHSEAKKLKAHAWLSAGEIELVSSNSDFLGIFFTD